MASSDLQEACSLPGVSHLPAECLARVFRCARALVATPGPRSCRWDCVFPCWWRDSPPPHRPPSRRPAHPACSYLSPTDLAAAACTHRAWREAVEHEEGVWRALSEAEFVLSTPTGPDRQPLPTMKAAYSAWRTSFGRYGALATRALRAWRQVEQWAAANFPAVAASLRCGRAALGGGTLTVSGAQRMCCCWGLPPLLTSSPLTHPSPSRLPPSRTPCQAGRQRGAAGRRGAPAGRHAVPRASRAVPRA